MGSYSGLRTANGDPVYSYEYIERLREADKQKSNPLNFVKRKKILTIWKRSLIIFMDNMENTTNPKAT